MTLQNVGRYVGLTLMWVALSAGSILAADQPATSEAASGGAEGKERLISLVLLLSAPRKLDGQAVIGAVTDATGISAKEAADTVTMKPPYYGVQIGSQRFVINDIGELYFENPAKVAGEIDDPQLSRAVREHRAWISIDWAGEQRPADLRAVYQQIGKLTVPLIGRDTLAVYSPDTGRLHLNDATLAKHLSSNDPLQDLGSVPGRAVPRPVSVSSEDPRLKEAEAEARRRWPEFQRAFKEKTGALYFAVKAPITESNRTEYMWIKVTQIDHSNVHGSLENDPEGLKAAKYGQDVHAKIADVEDWLYTTEADEVVGNFTQKVLDQAATQPRD